MQPNAEQHRRTPALPGLFDTARGASASLRISRNPLAKGQPTERPTNTARLIVLGCDEGNKPHAAWFDQSEVEGATAAAATMGLQGLTVDSDALRSLAGQLARGKIFASGKAFVPFVKGATYDALVGLAPEAVRASLVRPVAAAKPEKVADDPAKPASDDDADDLPTDWSKIKVGSSVVAEEGPTEGWWETIVVKALDQDCFELRWQYYPRNAELHSPSHAAGVEAPPALRRQILKQSHSGRSRTDPIHFEAGIKCQFQAIGPQRR